MPPRQTEEEQADFAHALQLIAEQEPLPQAAADALSVLEGDDLTRFRAGRSALPAAPRARLLPPLPNTAGQGLRLVVNALNRLATGAAASREPAADARPPRAGPR